MSRNKSFGKYIPYVVADFIASVQNESVGSDTKVGFSLRRTRMRRSELGSFRLFCYPASTPCWICVESTSWLYSTQRSISQERKFSRLCLVTTRSIINFLEKYNEVYY